MTRQRISTGSEFEKNAGYSRAVVQGNWCFISGTTGYDYSNMTMPEDVQLQTENCLATIKKTLAQAGFSFSDIVRVNYYVTDPSFADLVFPVVGNWFSEIRPAATMVVANLIRPEMKIEIEATALKEHSDQ